MRRIIVPTLAAFVAATGIAYAGPLRGEGDGTEPPREPGVSAKASAASDGGGKRLRDFTVTSTLNVNTCCAFVDVNEEGASIGDSVSGNFEVRRQQVHRGHFTQTITELEAEPDAEGNRVPRTHIGQTMYAFRDGTVSVQWVQDQREALTQGAILRGAITGGTGAYAGAKGELRTRYVSTVEEEQQTGLQVATERFDFVDGR